MVSLPAYQHFYSRLSREESPKRQSGFQTVFCSKELSPELVRAIEDRSQYNSAPGDPVKRQFYALPGGFMGISQSLPLAEPDEFGRKGRYLTHTLIFSEQDLQPLGAPFDIFTQFRFVTTLAGMLESGDRSTGHSPALRLDIRAEWENRALQSVQRWQPESLHRLGRLAWQISRLAEKRESVFLIGDDAERLNTLVVLFLLASPTQRTQLSFDSHALGCSWGREIFFWAQGFFTGDQLIRMTHKVDCRARTVESNLSSQDDSLYGRWLIESSMAQGLAKSSKRQLAAAALGDYLSDPSGPVPGTVPPIPDDIVSQFARMDPNAVAARWSAYFPPGLSRELTWSPNTPLVRMPEEYLSVLLDGITRDQVQEILFERLVSLSEPLAKNDRQILEKWIRENQHAGLSALLAFWAKDEKGWAKSISQVTPEHYEALLSGISTWKEGPRFMYLALVEPFSAQWLRKYARLVYADEWKNILNSLAAIDAAAVDRVTTHVNELSPEARAQIADWLDKYSGEAPALRSALGVPLKSKGIRFPKNPFGRKE